MLNINSLSPKQKRIYQWINDTLKLPVYADLYGGAAILLKQKPPGYVMFVAHAGRDLMNGLAPDHRRDKRQQSQYANLLDRIAIVWDDGWGPPSGLSESEQPSHQEIPRAKLVKLQLLINEHRKGRDRSEVTNEVFFSTFLNYSDKDNVPQNFAKERILTDETRLRFWLEHRRHIKRPIYVRAMVSAMQEQVTSKQFDVLEECIDFCEWVLSHSDLLKEKGVDSIGGRREDLGWPGSRRAVGDFVGTCLEEHVNVPISSREGLVSLLDKLCTQYEKHLDDEPVFLNQDDHLTEAINITRSRALEDLIDFGYWLRRQLQDDQAETPEVFAILEKRLGLECERPLTLPEFALLGLHFGRICSLSRNWATEHKKDLFPQEAFVRWKEAFGNFLKYNRPYRLAFDVMQGDIEFAINNVGNFQIGSNGTTNLADTLGEHLFTYYLWDFFPLTGKKSLLERYYEKTQDDRDRWSELFDFVGRSVKSSGKHLREDLKERIIKFFQWRLGKTEPLELKEFTYWLEAECLDPEWRLQSFSSTLGVGGSVDIGLYIQVKALREMLDQNLPLVVECFAKLVDRAVENDSTSVKSHLKCRT